LKQKRKKEAEVSNPRTRAKKKYNSNTYNRYEFNLRKDSKLSAIVERYKSLPDSCLSQLLKTLLCGHFRIDIFEADDIFAEYHIAPGGVHIRNAELDKYFPDPGGNP
jgi:hypothetical protein